MQPPIHDLSVTNTYVAGPGQTLFSLPCRLFPGYEGAFVVTKDGVACTYDAAASTNLTFRTVATGPEGLDIIFGAPLAGGEFIALRRELPKERLSSLPEAGPISIASLNAELTYITALIQDANEFIQGPPGDKGDPGSAGVIGLATDVAGINLNTTLAGTDVFRTEGYRTSGDNGQAWYRRMGALEAVSVGELVSLDGVRLGLCTNQALTPEMLAAYGDGVGGDFAAMSSLVTLANSRGAAQIRFAEGATYFYDGYVTAANGVSLNVLRFDALDGLTIEGNGAKIDIKGNFNRDANTTYPLCGFRFRNCKRVSVRGLEVDGNADQMTKAGGVTEPPGMGLEFYSCIGVTLANLELHHNAGDGLYIGSAGNGANQIACRSFSALNVNCHHNARQGMSITQLRDGSFAGCNFDYSGTTGGTYGGHSPQAGIDVEPNFSTASAFPNAADVNTGNIIFGSCTMKGSVGSAFSAVGSSTTDTVTLINCDLAAPTGFLSSSAVFYLDIPGGRMINCKVDAQQQPFQLGYSDNGVSTVSLDGCEIRWNGNNGLYVTHALASAVIRNCRFFGTHTAPMAAGDYAFLMDCANLVFEKNYFWMPKEAYVSGGGGNYHIIMYTGRAKRLTENEWATDLPQNQSGAATAHFANAFANSSTTPVYNDTYTGLNPGPASTFRPYFNANDDSTKKLNRRHKDARVPGSAKPGNGAYTHVASQGPELIIYDTPITADRAVTLSATLLFVGARVKIMRTAAATGAFNITAPGATIAAGGAALEYYSDDGATWTQVK
jgi:hypothetical protein